MSNGESGVVNGIVSFRRRMDYAGCTDDATVDVD
jgi:hypothetical protein